jgi:hypothetical protein
MTNLREAPIALPPPTARTSEVLGDAVAALLVLVGAGAADVSVFFKDEFDIEVDVNAGEVVDVWPPPNPCMINSPISID